MIVAGLVRVDGICSMQKKIEIVNSIYVFMSINTSVSSHDSYLFNFILRLLSTVQEQADKQ